MTTSVIIPTYNRKELIRHTLDSLDAAHHPGVQLEVIVVDDGSTDGTREFIAEHYPHARWLFNEGKGAAAARNTGLAAATGAYVMYLDSDDIVGKGYFAKKAAYLDEHADCEACYGAYDRFRADGEFREDKVIFQHKYPMHAGTRYAHEHLVCYLGGNFLPPHAIIWRRKFLQRIKGHDEELIINQDVELFVRAIFQGLRLMAIDDGTKVYARDHAVDARVGDPGNEAEKWKQIVRLRKKIFADMRKYAFEEDDLRSAMSSYLFGYWKKLRHAHPDIATDFLEFAKRVYWPVPVKGGLAIRLLAMFAGPERATEIKYKLLKRD